MQNENCKLAGAPVARDQHLQFVISFSTLAATCVNCVCWRALLLQNSDSGPGLNQCRLNQIVGFAGCAKRRNLSALLNLNSSARLKDGASLRRERRATVTTCGWRTTAFACSHPFTAARSIPNISTKIH